MSHKVPIQGPNQNCVSSIIRYFEQIYNLMQEMEKEERGVKLEFDPEEIVKNLTENLDKKTRFCSQLNKDYQNLDMLVQSDKISELEKKLNRTQMATFKKKIIKIE